MLYSSLVYAMRRAYFGKTDEEMPEREGAALVLVADGVGGFDLCGTALRRVAEGLEAPCVVRVFSWGHGFGRWHADLTNADNHASKAKALVEEALAFRGRWPGAPVFLVGKSGGSGLVVRALEAMPEGSIEAVVLIAPALSPAYDLTKALRAVRREMVVFWSPMDLIILGLGTRIFGTIDRRRAVSAGLVGFRRPKGLDAGGQAQYAKLRQVRWSPRMARTGYLGGHVGPDSPAFLRKYVLPLLRAAGGAKA